VLAEDIIALSDVPGFATAGCDGYAVAAQEVAAATPEAPVTLAVSHDVSFHSRAPRRLAPGAAARVRSGAPLPWGADAVVPVADSDGGVARVQVTAAPQRGSSVRPAGFDAPGGRVVVAARTRVGAAQMAAIAAVGRDRVEVHPVPRVVVMAIGDQLTEPGVVGGAGDVPDANSRMLAQLVMEAGARAVRVGTVGDADRELRAAIEDHLTRADLILTTGALSHGGHGALARVAAQLGLFEVYDLRVRPGVHHGAGLLEAGGRSVPIVALPGATAPAMLAFEAYVRPMLRAMAGFEQTERPQVEATLPTGWYSPADVEELVPVDVSQRGDTTMAVPLLTDGMVPLSALAAATGMMRIAPQVTSLPPGSVVTVTRWSDS
jgi:molybdopterin molybdotransferase